jgi:hypothetical protein
MDMGVKETKKDRNGQGSDEMTDCPQQADASTTGIATISGRTNMIQRRYP